ncbi:MAG: helix-turn-helix transcriptional regulator [Dehalococcoidia bacterium]
MVDDARPRGRPPHPDVLTPAEWRVLEHIRRGRTNAEIAVRLHISPNTVRYHVSNMLSKLHAQDRDALAAWDGAPRRTRGWAWLLAASLGGLAVVAAALVLAPIGGDGGGGSSDALALADDTTVEPQEARTCLDDAPAAAGYRAYEGDELAALGMVDVGPVFSLEDGRAGPVACTALRPTMSSVRFSGATRVDTGNSRIQATWLSIPLPDGRNGRVDMSPFGARQQVSTPVRGGITEIAFTSDGGMRIAPAPHAPETLPEVLFRLTTAGTQPADQFPVAVDRDGHLWTGDAITHGAYSDTTGAEVDTSTARWSARVASPTEGYPLGWYNPCTAGEPCTTTYYSRGFTPPQDGRLFCDTQNEARFVPAGGEWSLVLHAVMGGGLHEVCAEPGDVLDVRAGEELPVYGYINLRGYVDEQQISLITDRDDVLHFDVEPPSVGCPCLAGS